MSALTVYLKDIPVGRLEDAQEGLCFTYLPGYAAEAHPEPLSYALPVTSEPYRGAAVESYFSNLLPDDYIRMRLGQILQIPRENTFALLEAIGGDCAGAIALYPEGRGPESPEAPRYRELSETDAVRILGELEQRPLDVGEEGFRISGAGAQDKLVACVRNGTVLLPLGGTPSSHIIKPMIRNYPQSVENEHFCMRLAAACGLDVAENDILELGGNRYYVTTRYDRVREGERYRRLHQEDICQVLGVEPRHKYEKNGGPGLASMFALLRKLELSAPETLELFDRVIFNFLAGNGDAHGKNFSILYENDGARLAPMYDVMNTTVYPDLSRTMAMKIDGEYSFRWMSRGKFRRQGKALGFAERLVDARIDRMSKRILREAPKLVASLEKRWPCRIYAVLAEGVQQRVEQLNQTPQPRI